MPSQITQGLIDKLTQRDAVGLAKYGVSLDREDLTPEQWLDHKTEELLDAAGYAQSAKREIAKLRARVARLTAALETLREQAVSTTTMAFDDGDISVSDFISSALHES